MNAGSEQLICDSPLTKNQFFGRHQRAMVYFAARVVIEPNSEVAAGARVPIRLAQVLFEGVKASAKYHGISMGGWVASMIQSS